MKVFNHRDIYHKMYLEQGKACYYCHWEIEYKDMSRDHILPKNKGYGGDKNIVLSCRDCNSEKSELTIYQFRIKLCRLLGNYLRKNKQLGGNLTGWNKHRADRYYTAIKTCTIMIKENLIPNIKPNPNVIKKQIKKLTLPFLIILILSSCLCQ